MYVCVYIYICTYEYRESGAQAKLAFGRPESFPGRFGKPRSFKISLGLGLRVLGFRV